MPEEAADGAAPAAASRAVASVASAPVVRSLQRCATRDRNAIIAKIVSMERRLWKKADSWGPMFEREVQRRNTFVYVAVASPPQLVPSPPQGNMLPQEEVVQGYILFTVTGLVSHISKLLVVPEWRRRGIATALITAALDFSRNERRVGSATLHVDTENESAILLYRRFGFEAEGAPFEDYYGRGRHASKMRMQLTDDY